MPQGRTQRPQGPLQRLLLLLLLLQPRLCRSWLTCSPAWLLQLPRQQATQQQLLPAPRRAARRPAGAPLPCLHLQQQQVQLPPQRMQSPAISWRLRLVQQTQQKQEVQLLLARQLYC